MAANDMGTITRIALKNFVTYDEVVVKPGKNLNLILGPNGTGKSTIVSAIVLGLGGSPKVIGRAKQIGEYVKSEQTNASIEIDLQRGPHNVVTIKREFNTGNHTQWYIDNKASNGRVIKELMEQFNIQVDNLCQFLPQDKVQEFSNLSPQELLLETERSVGDPKLSEFHVQLKELRVQQATLEEQLRSNATLLTKEQRTCDLLKDKVGHIKEQQTIEKKLKVLKQKKAWVIYNEKRDEINKAKAERDEAKKTRDKLEKKLKPIEIEIAKLKNSIRSLEVTTKQKSTDSTTKAAKVVNLQGIIESDESLIDDAEGDFQRKIRDEQEIDQRIAEYREQRNKLENDLQHKINEVGSAEDIQSKLASITETVNKHRDSIKRLTQQQTFLMEKEQHCIRKMSVQKQNLDKLQNVEAQRVDLLHRLSRDAYTGYMWLRSNKHLFSKNIYEPMILVINVKDPYYAKYFENVISFRDLTAFVCEDKNDMNKLLSYLRDQQKLQVNAVHSDPDREIDGRPSIPLDDLKQFGFQHYMSDLIEAPKTVLNYLIYSYNLHNIPIGNDNILNYLDQLPNMKRFFSSQKSYSIRHSGYTGEKITTETVILSKDLLSTRLDSESINNINMELSRLETERQSYNSDIESLNEQIKQEEKKANSQKDIRKKLEMDTDKIKNLQWKIRSSDTKLKEIQSERKSVEEIHAEFKAKIDKLISRQLDLYKNYNKCLDEYYKSFIISEDMKVQVKFEKNQLIAKENDSHEVREEFENAERNFRNLENEMKPLRQELQNLYEEAKKSTDGISIGETDAFAKFQTAFAKLPSTLEEIISEIQKTQAKAFNVNDRNEAERIMRQYETAKKNLEKLGHDTTVKEEELIKMTEDINKVKEEWLPMLNSLVEKINKNFSSCFSKMKCAGEVSLIDQGSPMDFAKYGLRIKVKFRDADELQALSRNHQSGGERAVTTAAYMISLQELTRVPFRCVDEINQGMDATNERRVFELIVNITSMTNSAQYFLLTPKLLPDLEYNESMTVLTVYNGKYMAPSLKFDIQDKFDPICNIVRNRRRAER